VSHVCVRCGSPGHKQDRLCGTCQPPQHNNCKTIRIVCCGVAAREREARNTPPSAPDPRQPGGRAGGCARRPWQPPRSVQPRRRTCRGSSCRRASVRERLGRRKARNAPRPAAHWRPMPPPAAPVRRLGSGVPGEERPGGVNSSAQRRLSCEPPRQPRRPLARAAARAPTADQIAEAQLRRLLRGAQDGVAPGPWPIAGGPVPAADEPREQLARGARRRAAWLL